MTVNDLYIKTRTVLGGEAVGIDRNDETGIKKEAVKMLGILLDDLEIDSAVQNTGDTIICSKSAEQALIYGLAMLICVALGISEKQPFFAGLYSSYRARVKSSASRISDVLPRGEI